MQNQRFSNHGTRSLLQNVQKTVEDLTTTLECLASEAADADSQLQWLRQQINEVEEKYSSLLTHIEATRVSKKAMEDVVQNLQYQLSPMKSLPTEILIIIFELVMKYVDHARRSLITTGMAYPPDRTSLRLAQVCVRWRYIVTSNPSLRSKREFYSMIYDENKNRREAEIYRFQISRALPEHESLFIPACTYDQLEYLCRIQGELPTPFKSLEIDLLEDPDEGVYGQWHIDVLSSRDITIYRKMDVPTINFILPLLRYAHKITLYGSSLAPGAIPWALLDTLRIKDFCNVSSGVDEPTVFDRHTLVHVLNAAPSLRILQLDFQTYKDSSWTQAITANHTNLKHLAIHIHHLIGEGPFGIQITLPNLQTLEVLSFVSGLIDAADVKTYFRRIFPERVVLPVIRGCDVITVSELLCCLPTVTALELTGENSNDLFNFLNASYQSLHQTPTMAPVPRLITLTIRDTDIIGTTLLQFTQIKLRPESREMGIWALEEIRMYDTRNVSSVEWWRIHDMLQEGKVTNAVRRSNMELSGTLIPS